MRKATIATLAILTVTLAARAHASVSFGTCNGQIASKMTTARTWYLDANSTAWTSGVLWARDEWNAVPQATPMIDTYQCAGNCYAPNDGANDVVEFGTLLDNAWAINWIRTQPCDATHNGELIDSDIMFNASQNYTFSTPPNFPGVDILPAAVAIHEFGHSLGMDHENTKVTYMNGSGTSANINVHPRYGGSHSVAPFPDEIAFYKQNYPTGTGVTDIAATVFKQINGDGDIHWSNGTATLFGCPGQNFSLQWSLSNRGTTTHISPAPQYKIYVSSDDALDVGDLVAKTSTVGTIAGGHLEFTDTLVLPATLTKGAYYTFIIQTDSSAMLSETDEYNNTTIVRPRLQVKQNATTNCP